MNGSMGMSVSSGTSPTRRSQIGTEMDHLEKSICAVEEALGHLIERIDPIVFNPPSVAGASIEKSPGEAPICTHAGFLRKQAQRLDEIAARAVHYFQCVEL